MKFRKRSHLNTELGFIEIEYMIAAGLVVLLVASVSAGLQMMSKFQRSNDSAADSYYILQQLMTTLRTRDACTLALRNTAIPTAIGDAEAPVSIPVDLGAGATNIAVGAEPINGVRVTTMSLAFNNLVPSAAAAPAIPPIVTSTGTLYQKTLNLRFATEKIVNGESVGFTKPKEIPLTVLVNAANQVQYCEIDAGEARACAETGSKWDPNAPLVYDGTRPRCIPNDQHCDFGGSFSILDANCGPNTFVNPLTGDRSCPAGFVQQRTGTISNQVQVGKETIDNYFCPVYTCVRCSDSSPVTLAGNAPIVGPTVARDTSITGALQQNQDDQTNMNDTIFNNNQFIFNFP